MKGRLRDLTINRDGSQNITITIDGDFRDMFDELKEVVVEVIIKKFLHRRSSEANRYAWVLIDKIAERLQQKEPWVKWTPIMVYRNAIRDIGGVSIIIGIKTEAIETFRRNWEANHLGRQVEVIDGSGKEGWSNVKVYYGSSEFDTSQMSRLISSLIQDAEGLGIPTISDKEAAKMVGSWKPRGG